MGLVNEMRAKATLALIARGAGVVESGVPVIPKKWEKFPGTEDVWSEIDFPESENTSSCIYKGKANTVFKPHVHKKHDEHFTIINPEGEIEVITDTKIFTVRFPESVFIPMGTPHAIRFKKDSNLLVMWHPKMQGKWDGDFLTEDQINLTPSKT